MKRLLRSSRNSSNSGGTRPPDGFLGARSSKTRPEVGFHLTRLAPLIALLTTTSTFAALVPTEWEHRQKLTVPAAGLVSVDLTAASFDAAGPQQEDFRILDPNGREVAYLLDHPPTPIARIIRPASFAVRLESGATRITLTTGTNSALTSLTLETPNPFFLRAATVEISDDNTQWVVVDQGVPLFRQWGAEKLELPLGNRTATYIRITLNERHGAPLAFTGASLNLSAKVAPKLSSVGSEIVRRDEFSGETVFTLALDGRHVPLAALELPASDPLFMRRVTVTVREVNGAIASEQIVSSGTLYRVALDGSPTRALLEMPLDFTPLTREVLVHIHNGDSPPLTFDAVNLKRRALNLLFMAPVAGTYTLLSGNIQATAPRYDLAVFAGDLREASTTTVAPGELEAMPNYHPRESLGTLPLPDAPLAGSPLNTKEWTKSRPLQLVRAGVQELELDPAALAKAQTDLGDLRLLHGGNQIPYVLEQSSLARALMLNPVAVTDPKRPSVSLWKVPVPYAGLPLRRLILTSSTPLFQRQFRLYEKLTNQSGGTYEITLASGDWSRTPEPGIPETRTFEIANRFRTDTLWIETNNGDNPAIALGAVQVIYPVVRLIFKTAETEGFTLAYGNPVANAPRYDVSLVAVKLLTSPRNIARLDAGDPDSSGGRNPFAGLKSGYLFWGALGLVVIVLLVVVAKLLPKPPAG